MGKKRKKVVKHPPRGPGRYVWTYTDLSGMTGRSVKTLQNYAAMGRFDPRDFATVVRFILEWRDNHGLRLSSGEVGDCTFAAGEPSFAGSLAAPGDGDSGAEDHDLPPP